MFTRKELVMIMQSLMNEDIYKSKELYEENYSCEKEKEALERQINDIKLLARKVFGLINES